MSQLSKLTSTSQSPDLANRVMFCHFRQDNINFTIAYQFSDTNSKDSVQVNVAYAFCSERDQYNKEIGRNISSGRLRSNANLMEFATQPTNKEVVHNAIAAGIEDFGTFTLAEGGQNL